MVESLSKEAWSSWKTSHGTRFFLQHIYQKREDLKEGLAEGQAGTDIATYIGQCQAYKDVIEFITREYEITNEEEAIESAND